MIYRTREGDTADLIAWREMGGEAGAAALLDANPILADLPPVLPYGIDLVLPSAPSQPQQAPLRLWGAS